jgi:hypothetical protein
LLISVSGFPQITRVKPPGISTVSHRGEWSQRISAYPRSKRCLVDATVGDMRPICATDLRIPQHHTERPNRRIRRPDRRWSGENHRHRYSSSYLPRNFRSGPALVRASANRAVGNARWPYPRVAASWPRGGQSQKRAAVPGTVVRFQRVALSCVASSRLSRTSWSCCASAWLCRSTSRRRCTSPPSLESPK